LAIASSPCRRHEGYGDELDLAAYARTVPALVDGAATAG
jgi:hypothetical protein